MFCQMIPSPNGSKNQDVWGTPSGLPRGQQGSIWPSAAASQVSQQGAGSEAEQLGLHLEPLRNAAVTGLALPAVPQQDPSI